jgi:hypothetical protein
MDGEKAVTATFLPDPARVRIENDPATRYYAIGAALAAPTQDGEIRALAPKDFVENITMTNPVTILLKGGYSDTGFSNQSGYSTISGYLKIRAGELKIDHLRIKSP